MFRRHFCPLVRYPLPFRRIRRIDSEKRQSVCNTVCNNIVCSLRFAVHRRNRGKHHAAHFCYPFHIVQMGKVQRCFADHQYQPPPFLQNYIRRTCQQIVAEAVCNRGKCPHRTGCNQHPVRFKRTAGNACPDIANRMDEVSQSIYFVFRIIRFRSPGHLRTFRYHKVCFDILRKQKPQCLNAVSKAACPADADNQPSSHHPPFRYAAGSGKAVIIVKKMIRDKHGYKLSATLNIR